MNKNTLPSILKNLGIVILFAFLMAGGVAGIPSWSKEETTIGYVTVSKNPFGIAIYQQDKHASVQLNGFDTFTKNDKTLTVYSRKTTQQTIGYSRDDIIFDDLGNLYTEPPEKEQMYVENILTMALLKIADPKRTTPILSSTMFIINPNIPGILKIQFPKEVIITIDREQKLIHTEQPLPSLTITIFDVVEQIHEAML